MGQCFVVHFSTTIVMRAEPTFPMDDAGLAPESRSESETQGRTQTGRETSHPSRKSESGGVKEHLVPE